jgi:hypothetical protein
VGGVFGAGSSAAFSTGAGVFVFILFLGGSAGRMDSGTGGAARAGAESAFADSSARAFKANCSFSSCSNLCFDGIPLAS